MIAFFIAAAVMTAQPCAAGAGACGGGDVERVYQTGMAAAARAYSDGGSAESLAPVHAAAATLERLSEGRPGPAEIARLVLLAAAAAAQSERDEMGAFLAHATAMEVLQLAAGQPGAPGLTALEAAGDLWLRVHRFDDARAAYQRAAMYLGMTPRIQAGLAKATR
jgi:hypothetical protein